MSDWDLARDVRALARRDEDLAAALERFGLPPTRRCARGFSGLARMIVFQQVSGASGTAIWNRLEAAAQPLKPEVLAGMDEAELRGVGLSRQKAQYIRALANAVLDGSLDFDRVDAASDEAATQEITRVKGLGVWSAENYLLFALERRDVFPAGDLALRLAAELIKRKRKPLTPASLTQLAKQWSPYRSAAAHFLWHYYGQVKGGQRETSRPQERGPVRTGTERPGRRP